MPTLQKLIDGTAKPEKSTDVRESGQGNRSQIEHRLDSLPLVKKDPLDPEVLRSKKVRTRLTGGVPADFGAPGGTPIANAQTILPEVWKAMGHDGPPDIAVYAFGPAGNDTSGFSHACVAYRDGDRLVAVNISSPDGASGRMVNPMPIEEHLFGVDAAEMGSEQGGIYNRDVAIRGLWNCTPDQIAAVKGYFAELAERESRGEVRFGAAGTGVRNAGLAFKAFFIGGANEVGNCSRWSSRALMAAGLIPSQEIFPAQLFNAVRGEVVVFDSPQHAVRTVGHKAEVTLETKSGVFGHVDLAEGAKVTVDVPPGTIEAKIRQP